ncbi:MAG: hypothetical protein JSV49_09320 [Thermoplasmata archaeon]|nr:MAG: hypothetical protein JSV49_09320 [Thermoplasmata archaeon]
MAAEAENRAFKYIKDKDKPNLMEVVNILKSQNLDVYISGSAIMVPEYSDIDLLICDPNFVIKDTENKDEFEISPLAQTAIDGIINREGVNLKKSDHERSGGYIGSKISGYRWEFDYKGTNIDISYAQEPFGLTREKIAKLEAEVGGELGLEPEFEKF